MNPGILKQVSIPANINACMKVDACILNPFGATTVPKLIIAILKDYYEKPYNMARIQAAVVPQVPKHSETVDNA